MNEDHWICTSCNQKSSYIYNKSTDERLCRTCKSKEMNDGFECPCGKWDSPSNWSKDSLISGLCFDCSFWENLITKAEQRESGSIRIDGHHYYVDLKNPIKGGIPSHRGFAGRSWNIRFRDGATVRTDNLWYQGQIPERFKDRLPDNADFVFGDHK